MMKTAILLSTLALVAMACSQKQSAEQAAEAAHTGTGVFDGKVKSSTHPNVSAGSACNGTMTMRGTKKPGSMTIKCDGVSIYNGDGVFTNNTNDLGNPDDDTSTFRDDKTTAEDKTPAVSMVGQEGKADGDSGIITVNDVEAGNVPAFEVVISL